MLSLHVAVLAFPLFEKRLENVKKCSEWKKYIFQLFSISLQITLSYVFLNMESKYNYKGMFCIIIFNWGGFIKELMLLVAFQNYALGPSPERRPRPISTGPVCPGPGQFRTVQSM